MSELLPTLSSNTIQEECFVHVLDIISQQSICNSSPPFLLSSCFSDLSVVAGHCGVLTCLVSVLLFDEWYLGNFGGSGLKWDSLKEEDFTHFS